MQKHIVKAIRNYRKYRNGWRRSIRLLFPSPAEIRFIRIMGGEVVVFPHIINWRTKFPLAWVVDLGPWLKAEYIKREVRCGYYFIDFGNDILRGIEIDGAAFHQNKAREMARDEYLESCGWLIFHIKASRIWRDPDIVSNQVRLFLWEGRTAAKKPAARSRTRRIRQKWGV